MLGRDGKPTANYGADLSGISGLGEGRWFTRYVADGSGTDRVPKGGYLLDAWTVEDPDDTEGADWLVQPKLSVTKNVSVTIDARKAKPADITVPDAAAKQEFGVIGYQDDPAGGGFGRLVWRRSRASVPRTSAGATAPSPDLDGQWSKGATEQYDTVSGGDVKRLQR